MNTCRIPALMVLAVLPAACSIDIDAQSYTAAGSFERTLQVTGPVEIDVQTGSGSISVRQGPERDVRIVGQIRANRGFWNNRGAEERVRALEASPPVVQEGNSIRIGEITDPELRRNVSISYQIAVPFDASLKSRSGSGSVDVESIAGPVEVRTGSGRVTVGKIPDAVMAETGSGGIDILGAGKGLNARTGSGGVDARDVAGPVEAHSGSGRIRIAYSGPGDGNLTTGSGGISVVGLRGRLRARAGSGSINVDGQPTGDWSIDSGSGGITLRLPPDAAFDLNARSSSGGVHTTHPIEARGAMSRNGLQGRVRGGGPRLDLTTGSGGIRLE